MKKYTNLAFLIALASFAVFAPLGVSAATVSLEASRTSLTVGDTAIITVKVSAEGKVVNTVEGDLAVNSVGGDIAVQEFSLANSAFGLWPQTPVLSADGRTVTFVGGVPGGFSIEGATIFKVIVEATKAGTVTIRPQKISVYENDGNGTKLPVQSRGITLSVAPKSTNREPINDWDAIVTEDTTKPEEFIIVPGQNDNLFEGKKFVYFSALDNQSGIDYYDVSENGEKPVKSGSTYVLKDQSDTVRLSVTAYDKAGNKRTATYSAGDGITWWFVIAVVMLGVVIKFGYSMWRRRKNNAQSFS